MTITPTNKALLTSDPTNTFGGAGWWCKVCLHQDLKMVVESEQPFKTLH